MCTLNKSGNPTKKIRVPLILLCGINGRGEIVAVTSNVPDVFPAITDCQNSMFI